jgi:hypothetical protein
MSGQSPAGQRPLPSPRTPPAGALSRDSLGEREFTAVSGSAGPDGWARPLLQAQLSAASIHALAIEHF